MKNKYLYLGVIALLAVFGLSIYAFGYSGPAPKVVVEGDYMEAPDANLGVAAGPDVYFETFFYEGLYDGGGILSATTTPLANDTLTAKEVCENNVIVYGLGNSTLTTKTAAINVTLPATSTLFQFCLNEDGMHNKFLFINDNAAAASSTTIVAGAGTDLLEPTGGDVVIGGGSAAVIDMWRCDSCRGGGVDDLPVMILVDEIQVAD